MAKTSDYLQNIVCLESYDLHTKMRQVLSCIRHAVNVSDNTHTHTHTHTRLTALFQDYPGEPVSER